MTEVSDPATKVDVSSDLLQVLERLSDGLLLLDRSWRLTYANARAREISRILPEYLNSRTHWEIYPATVGTEQERIYRRVMASGIPEEFEFYYAPYDIWIQLRAMPVETGIAVLYQNVSELRRVQSTAASTSRQLHQVFEVTTDAIASLDRQWRYTFLNRRAKELLDVGDDLLGEVLWHRFPQAVYPGSPYVEHYYRTMNERVPSSFEAFYPAPLDKWLRLEVQPSEEGIVVFFRDITQHKRDEEELRREKAETERQRAELEAVYRTAPVGLALLDPDGFRYLRVNDRQALFLGLPADSLVGRTFEDVVDNPEPLEMFRRVAQGETVRDFLYETELKHRPGEKVTVNANYSPVRDADGQVSTISAAVMDVTQLRKAERALVQSEKLAAVGRLASSISHEINNPLEAVTNLLYLLDLEDLPPQARAYVHSAQDELSRVSQIATQTLRFHRQANKPTLVTPAQLVDAVLNLFQGRLANSGIHVEASYSTTTRVLCFENDIRQVLNNLIANAIDAMRSGGRLMVRAHDARHRQSGLPGVRISVGDNGSGMTAETLQRLFEPFYTTKDLNGTGLGLWISKDIVERHKGSLVARSSQDPVRRGTVFSLFLPVAPPL